MFWIINNLKFLDFTWVSLQPGSPWAVYRKMHSVVLIENKDNFSAAAGDISIVCNGACSCFGWLTCLRVIVWCGVCCASLILALKYMSVCSPLTLCLSASGSYVKCACHKNTFHINLLGPLVETLALMNHELSENESLFTQQSSVWKTVSSSLRVGRLFGIVLEKASCARWTIVHCSGQCFAETTARSDDLSDALYQQQSRAESPWVARLWLCTGLFSPEWVREAGCKDNRHTENLISFGVTQSFRGYRTLPVFA